ncbi:cupin domain-containing protein [Paracraurococcus lichenis]|uniref:Cupin domain-containing protein n=1 Tax=Paracraurococcus lichenis TaxID=3064888 RepID=A0ABT9DT55_9PROT|nr:cupin domain-containing protein [Paracraurococcus sp. LOR1-02]MDO9707089.1 cupin domain-containing protein [Paracraurococcus sp. LOR1-02]
MSERPPALRAMEVPARPVPTGFPEDLVAALGGREKRVLGDPFGLRNFGVNLVRLPPGAASSLRHAHARQDEWIYVLAGTPTLVLGDRQQVLAPGDCAGFPAGTGEAHHLVNRSDAEVLFLEVGDRSPGDSVTYPDDDLAGAAMPEGDWRYTRKDGTPI